MRIVTDERELTLNNKKVPYLVRKSRRSRRIKIAFDHTRGFVVSAPLRTPDFMISGFLLTCRGWISKYLPELEKLSLKTEDEMRHDFLKHKGAARVLVVEKVAHFTAFYGVKYGQIRIRDQKSVWGSCSRHGNLNFNYRIALLPPHLADYLVVHEVCHLLEFNHSAKFWAHVERGVPNYKACVSELRDRGMTVE